MKFKKLKSTLAMTLVFVFAIGAIPVNACAGLNIWGGTSPVNTDICLKINSSALNSVLTMDVYYKVEQVNYGWQGVTTTSIGRKWA